MDTYKSLHDGNCHFQKSTEKTCVNYVVEWWGIFVTRCQGQNDEPPEMVLNWKLSATTLLGVGISLSAISYLSAFFGPEGEQSFLVMMLGSYGALATLLFAAPKAPLSQPRMVFGGHTIAIFVAVIFDLFSEPSYNYGAAFITRELALALAPAFAIMTMQMFGVSHPPAGAVVLVFLTSPIEVRSKGFFFYIPAFLGLSILVFTSFIINNAFLFRPSYPRFW